MLISFHLQLSCFDLVSTLYYCCIIIITVWSLELNAFIHPSSSVCLLLSCLRFLSSGIFSFLCDGRNGRHRNREPMVKWEKDWGRKERQAMRKIQKEGGPTLRSALHPFLPRSSSLLFLFFGTSPEAFICYFYPSPSFVSNPSSVPLSPGVKSHLYLLGLTNSLWYT